MKRLDIPDHPSLGKVYPGDYLKDLPFDDYIHAQPLPEGLTVFDVRSYGAKPDTEELQTESFSRCSEAIREAGGGVFYVAGGCYICGTVWIPSNTILFIEKGSELRAARAAQLLIGETPEDRKARKDEESSGGAFIRSYGEEHVVITGGGIISGSGEWYVYEPRELPALTPFLLTALPTRAEKDRINTIPDTNRYYYRQRIRYAEDKYNEEKPALKRPSFMVWLDNCRDVRIENIILRDAMCWTLHVQRCENVLIRDLVIDDNRHVANTDGIDMTGCIHVEITHCLVSCADDGICLKNPKDSGQPMEDIHVQDCTVVSVMSAFKIGTGTYHPIRHVLVENCRFEMPDIYPGSVTGISIESCDGSDVQDVTVRNITMDNVQCPLYILLNRRNEGADAYTEVPGENAYWGGKISKIVIENIKAENAELPSIVTGFADTTLAGVPVRRAPEDITIRNMVIHMRDNQEVVRIPETFDEFLTDYPESNAHGDVDACGLWVRHTDRIHLSGLNFKPRSCNTRETVKLYDVEMGEE